MRNLIATYESHLAVKVLMFLCFSKWAAGFGCVYNTALAVQAYQVGGWIVAFPSMGFVAFNSYLLVRTYLSYRQTLAY
jgi:hypothetical protein